MIRTIAAALVLAVAASAATAAPIFDPRAHRQVAGPPTEVLVLGTQHLAELPDTIGAAQLAPVVDRLAAWKPEIVAIENLSGAECDQILRYRAIYADTADGYCMDRAAVGVADIMSVPEATGEIERRLAAWPAAPSAAERRGLALLFLAAGDRASAYVQWLRLPAAERRAGDGLTPKLVAYLDATGTRRNESYLVAAVLAARLGHDRVWPVDDHTADATVVKLGKDYGKALEAIWAGATPRMTKIKAHQQGLDTPAGMLAHYRYMNSAEAAADAYRYDFGAALNHEDPARNGRRYAGWWETRNLRMVANLREAMARAPGARVLAIVGASHKGYYEAYLDMMHEVRIADVQKVLR